VNCDSTVRDSSTFEGRLIEKNRFLLFLEKQILAAGRSPTAMTKKSTDGEIGEIIAHVALNIFTNYFNVSLDVDVDFPRVALQQVA
jgi:hypothetical protein